MGWIETAGLFLALIVFVGFIGFVSFWMSKTPARRAAIFALPQRRTIVASRFVANHKAAHALCRWIWHPRTPKTYHTGQLDTDIDPDARPTLLKSPLIAGGFAVHSIKRGADIFFSVALLVFTAPLLLLVAVAIKACDGGPILYRQARLGQGGIPFTLLKFRTMMMDAEKDGPVWAEKNDVRVTPIGRLLRVTRIDEIPQAISVLSGKMSFVGPRPERPEFLEKLSDAIPRYEDRLLVKPGITGWAQVNYPYGAS
ncbi:MAG: sugar transferase, partial [Pseudomonadota bacterium]